MCVFLGIGVTKFDEMDTCLFSRHPTLMFLRRPLFTSSDFIIHYLCFPVCLFSLCVCIAFMLFLHAISCAYDHPGELRYAPLNSHPMLCERAPCGFFSGRFPPCLRKGVGRWEVRNWYFLGAKGFEVCEIGQKRNGILPFRRVATSDFVFVACRAFLA